MYGGFFCNHFTRYAWDTIMAGAVHQSTRKIKLLRGGGTSELGLLRTSTSTNFHIFFAWQKNNLQNVQVFLLLEKLPVTVRYCINLLCKMFKALIKSFKMSLQ